MSKDLAYIQDDTQLDWHPFNGGYEPGKIDGIEESGRTKSPRTSIPSPFAPFELVQQAFCNVIKDRETGRDLTELKLGFLGCDERDASLVSNALDVAQLFFEYSLDKNYEIVTWNKKDCLDELCRSSRSGQQLLGETLEMFMRQESFLFDKLDCLYMIRYRGGVIGATSPTSLFIATPDYQKPYDLKIDGHVNIFEKKRQLFERDKDFVIYLYELFEHYPDFKGYLGNVYGYLKTVKVYLSKSPDSSLYESILDAERRGSKGETLLERYDEFEKEGVCLFGSDFKLFHRRKEDAVKSLRESDFIIAPDSSKNVASCPMILSNDLPETNWKYFGNTLWTKTLHYIDFDEINRLSVHKKTLPGTDIEFEWLYACDFLDAKLLRYTFPIDAKRFFNGNKNEKAKFDYLLPIKDTFFKYYPASYLKEKNNSKPNFEIVEKGNCDVEVILRIKVARGKIITLKKSYSAEKINKGLGIDAILADDTSSNPYFGDLVEIPVSLAVFPFVRLKEDQANLYNIQFIDALGSVGFGNIKTSLGFYKDSGKVNVTEPHDRLKENEGAHSVYYSFNDAFDYIRLEYGAYGSSGIIVPNWQPYYAGVTEYKFAFDFGTTNSHVEVMNVATNQISELKISTMIATLYAEKELGGAAYNKQFEVLLNQEFVPLEIGKDYSFPQRTVVSENRSSQSSTPDALLDINIPFLYERESEGLQNNITSNLKWTDGKSESKNNKANAFIQELLFLARVYVLQNDGDITKTKIVWSYPLSMRLRDRKSFRESWTAYFQKYFYVFDEKDSDIITEIPESVAPYIYYYTKDRVGVELSVSVDIGGGTSDIVIIRNNGNITKDNIKDNIRITSFRFAANVLFGDGFASAGNSASNNPMIQKYYDYFCSLDLVKNSDLKGIIEKVYTEPSEVANAFFFSIENNPLIKDKLKGVTPMKQKEYSFNYQLSRDYGRGIIFIYFYAAIIYYITRLLESEGWGKPENIMFSGNGAKVLNIIGDGDSLKRLSKGLIEQFSTYRYKNGIDVLLEKEEPKQITAKGTLAQFTNDKTRILANSIKEHQKELTCYFSPGITTEGIKALTHDDLSKERVLCGLVTEVERFNGLFIKYCFESEIWNEFSVDETVFKTEFIELLKNAKIASHLSKGINTYIKKGDNEELSTLVEDIPFFYPIINIIRRDLLENIK